MENKQKNDSGPRIRSGVGEKRYFLASTFGFAMEFGFIIALPIIILGYLGKRLDQHYHTQYFALIGILVALTVTVIWLTKRMQRILKELKK